MKYFHLIWAALFRSKTRSLLTLLSVTAAFLLHFASLQGYKPRLKHCAVCERPLAPGEGADGQAR